jgi:hypothetical protein
MVPAILRTRARLSVPVIGACLIAAFSWLIPLPATAARPVDTPTVQPGADTGPPGTPDKPQGTAPAPLPGTTKDVLVPPGTGDTEINKGTPPRTEFPTPVIRPPATGSPVPARPADPK